MKKILLLTGLLHLLFTFIATLAAAAPPQPDHVRKLPESVTRPPVDPDRIPRVAILKLEKVEIGTTNQGKWLWRATVKNMGFKAADGTKFIVQGYSRNRNSSNWLPASGSILSRDMIKPGQSVTVTRFWHQVL